MRPSPVEFSVGGLAAYRYETVEPAVGEIVIVHGAMDRAAGFRRVARHLPNHRIITYDRRGYDGSQRVAVSARIDDHVADLNSVCETCSDPPLIVGHSQGGLLALRAVSGESESTAAGAVVWEPPMPWFEWYSSVGDELLGCGPETAAERFMTAVLGERLWNRLPASMKAARLSEGSALLADIEAARSDSAVVDFASIDAKVIAGRGSESSEHHRRASATVAERVPGCRLIEVDGASHGVHLTHPAEFARIIESWFGPADPAR